MMPLKELSLQKEYSARREAGLDIAALRGTPLYKKTGIILGVRPRPAHAKG